MSSCRSLRPIMLGPRTTSTRRNRTCFSTVGFVFRPARSGSSGTSDNIGQSGDPLLQLLGQANENHWSVRPERGPLVFGLEHKELLPRKRQQSFDQPADGVANGRSPPCGDAAFFHPRLSPALDNQESLRRDIGIDIYERPGAEWSGTYGFAVDLSQGNFKELALQFRK